MKRALSHRYMSDTEEVEMGKKYDAIIIGAGPGGVTCAALLAKRGLHVLVLDKNERVGGKQMTASIKGYKGELWPTGGMPMNGGSWIEAFRALGIESKFRVSIKDMSNLYRRSGGEWLRTVTHMDPYELPDPNILFDQWELNAKERESALQILTEIALMPPDEINSLDDTTVREYLERYEVMPRRFYGYFAMLTHAFNVGLIDLVPMSEVVKTFQRLMGQPLGYPIGGYGRMSEDIAQVIKDCGSEIKTGTRVEKIIIEDGQATGVITRDAVFRAPIIVSNAGIQPTVLKLVDEQHFDKSYISYVKSLLPSNGFTGCHYVLSKPVLEYGLYQIWSDDAWWDMDRQDQVKEGHMPADLVMTVLVPTNYDPEMGPPGKQLLVFGTPCSPNPADETIEALWKKTDQQMAEMFPEIVPFIESKGPYSGPAQVAAASRDQVLPAQGGEACGLCVTIGQCGKYKPSAKSPITGLFYVGFDAGSTAFMGSQQAVDSGLRVAPLVHHYYLEKRQSSLG
ncbi:MAG: NAD(P)/FAD-dependent oxidoreductase [Chloroflexota bacterium]|nr:NAD(P)/FAD-dependent oxidoreductase [Chloroflexota bacterium]